MKHHVGLFEIQEQTAQDCRLPKQLQPEGDAGSVLECCWEAVLPLTSKSTPVDHKSHDGSVSAGVILTFECL